MSDYKDPRGKPVQIKLPDGSVIDNPEPVVIDTTKDGLEIQVPAHMFDECNCTDRCVDDDTNAQRRFDCRKRQS